MNRRVSLICTAVAVLLIALPMIVTARAVRAWTYEEMQSASDLVVIATPVKTELTGEEIRMGGLGVVGVSTHFNLLTSLKGHVEGPFVLHHYRFKDPSGPKLNPPLLVSFDGLKAEAYLMFLKNGPDGRFVPVTGQEDPENFSILKLSGFASTYSIRTKDAECETTEDCGRHFRSSPPNK